jgi:hypothetical protein
MRFDACVDTSGDFSWRQLLCRSNAPHWEQKRPDRNPASNKIQYPMKNHNKDAV